MMNFEIHRGGGDTLPQKHKNILFDAINEPSREEQARRKAQAGNRVRFLLFGIVRWLIIICVSLAGSLLLTIIITAIMQGRSIPTVAADFWSKFLQYIGVST